MDYTCTLRWCGSGGDDCEMTVLNFVTQIPDRVRHFLIRPTKAAAAAAAIWPEPHRQQPMQLQCNYLLENLSSPGPTPPTPTLPVDSGVWYVQPSVGLRKFADCFISSLSPGPLRGARGASLA